MNSKEAFRFQNKIQSFMDEAQNILDRDAISGLCIKF